MSPFLIYGLQLFGNCSFSAAPVTQTFKSARVDSEQDSVQTWSQTFWVLCLLAEVQRKEVSEWSNWIHIAVGGATFIKSQSSIVYVCFRNAIKCNKDSKQKC